MALDLTVLMPVGLAQRLGLALVLSLAAEALAQTKAVPEPCDKDADCQTGNCVSLKSESKKVCLYCRQDDYDGYWSDVQSKCKNLDEIGAYKDLQSQLQKQANKRGEFSLPYLMSRFDLNKNCLTARSTREKNCWKEKIDSGHQDRINELETALRFTDDLIKDSIRNGKAYTVDRAHFDELTEDEDKDCRELRDDFKWFSGFKDDEKLDCSKLSSIINRTIDCREVRKSIVSVFKDGASSERRDALKEVEAAEAEAKRTLDLKKSKSLCL